MLSLLSLRRYVRLYFGSRAVLVIMLALAWCLAAVPPASAQDQGLRYTLAPVGNVLFESDNSTLDRTLLYGGELGLEFGQYLQVSGEFLLNNDVGTDFADITGLAGFPEPSVDLRRYGGQLRVNVGIASFIPFLSAGTGVLDFAPEDAESSRSIYATAGIGLGYELVEGVRASVAGELLSYRYNPVSTFLGEDIGVTVDERTVHSPSVRASIAVLLGGGTPDRPTPVDESLRQQFGNGLRNLRVFLNPFYGRLAFNDALGFPKDQNFAGFNAGVDLGPFVGLRGFYARGTTGDDVFDEFATDFEHVQMYGGELRLYLSPRGSMGVVPYGLLGGGYLDVLSEYVEDIPSGAVQPEDRYFATAGGGVKVPLASWVALMGDVRGVFMSSQEDIEDVSTPDEVYGSLMYMVGLEFGFGGGRDEPSVPTERAPVPVEADTAVAEDTTVAVPPGAREAEELRTQVESLQEQVDTLERSLSEQQRAIEQDTRARADVPADSLVTPQEVEDLVQQEVEGLVREEVSAQMQQLEVDTVRVDTGEQLTEEDVERIAQQTLREEGGVQPGDTMAAAQQRAEMQRLEQQVEALQQEVNTLRQQLGQQPQPEEPTPPAAAAPQQAEPDDQEPFYRTVLGRPLTGVLPEVGVRGGEGPTHFLVGVRGDYRTQPTARFHLLPEAFLGFGEGATSVGLLANVGYSFLQATTEEVTGIPLEPYVGVGAGFVSPTGLDLEFVGNLMLGVDYQLENGNSFFLELSTFNLFDFTRFSGGYRIRI